MNRCLALAAVALLPGGAATGGAANSVRFDATREPVLDVRRLKTGHLLVRPRVDEQDLGWFLFDTGSGSNVLAAEAALRLSLEPSGHGLHRGVSGKEVPFLAWKARSLELGPVRLLSPEFVGLDLDFLSRSLGTTVVGVLGHELLLECIVEFRQSDARIALHDPATYRLTSGAWQGILLHERIPCVRGTFEGREGRFRIDTGAPQDTVTFHAPSVLRYGLLDERSTRRRRITGIAGHLTIEEGLLSSFELGGVRFESLPAGFAIEDVGPLADPHVDGNVGGRLLEPFTVVFDYRRARIAFVTRPF